MSSSVESQVEEVQKLGLLCNLFARALQPRCTKTRSMEKQVDASNGRATAFACIWVYTLPQTSIWDVCIMLIIAMSMVDLCRIDGYQILVAYCTSQRVTQTFYTFIFSDRVFTFSHSTSTVAFYHSRIRIYVFRVAKLAKQPHSLLVALDVDVPADDSAAVRRELEAQLPADSMSGACHLVKQHHTFIREEVW